MIWTMAYQKTKIPPIIPKSQSIFLLLMVILLAVGPSLIFITYWVLLSSILLKRVLLIE